VRFCDVCQNQGILDLLGDAKLEGEKKKTRREGGTPSSTPRGDASYLALSLNNRIAVALLD
jgi:hypothetical protein